MKLRVIRGERIKAALLEAASFDQLYQNIERAFPDTPKRQHATSEVTVTSIRYVPVRMTSEGGALQLATTTRSNQNEYKQQLLFSDISYETEDTEENITFKATNGQEYHVKPIPLNGSRIRVNCNCMDFHYRFAVWNFNNDTLMGRKPKPYQRKTDNRPPVNPAQVDGLCKHLIKVCNILEQKGLLTS
jgi:phage/plasmid-associated DNA primase